MIFRGRCTQQWDHWDVERLLFPEQYILNNSIFNQEFNNNDDDSDNNNNAQQYLEMNIELLRQMNQTETNNRKLNPINSYVKTFENLLNDIFITNNSIDNVSSQNYTINKNNFGLRNINNSNSNISNEIIIKISNDIKSNPTIIYNNNANNSQSNSSSNIHFNNIANTTVENMCKDNNRLQTNTLQKTFLLKIADYLDNLNNSTLSEQSQQLIFLHCAGGTEKSFIFSCIETLVEICNKSVIFSSLTGIACTAIPTKKPAKTTASTFKLGLAPSKIKNLKDSELLTIRSEVDSNNLVIIVIDEFGFGDATLLAAVDIRMQEIMNNDIIFGGVMVMLAGDFIN